MTTRCAIWARVSTGEQETANQLGELRAWAARKGFEVTVEYVLEESAWKGDHRAELARALQDARSGKFTVMLVWKLDRIGREGVEDTLRTLRLFREQGCVVWSLSESWTETSDPRMAELLSSLFAWMAAEESRVRSERTRAGMARKQREDPGYRPGRQAGARDKRPRKRAGYVARWERARATPSD